MYKKYKNVEIIPRGWFEHPENIPDELLEKKMDEAAAIDTENDEIYREKLDKKVQIYRLIEEIWGPVPNHRALESDSGRILAYMKKQNLRKPYNARGYVKQIIDKRNDAKKKKEKEISDRQKQRETEQLEREKLFDLFKITTKYNLTHDYSIFEALRALRNMNKYLDLGMAMLDVREDWSEGCDAVGRSLDNFAIDGEPDESIFREISKIVMDFEDGRSFRDCHWNYDRLFQFVPGELLDDAMKLRELDET